MIISGKFLVNELTDFYEAASYCPHNDKKHKNISWLTQYICCAGILFPGDSEHSFTKRKYSGEKKIIKKKFTAQYLYLWLLSKITREMPVGTVVIVNVKHCAVLLFSFFFFHIID